MIRAFVAFVLAALVASMAWAGPTLNREPVTFDFRGASVGQVVQLIYGEALHVPFVIDADVLSDARLVSFRFAAANGDIRSFVRAFFDEQGLTVETRGGVDYVHRKPEVTRPDDSVFVYKPKYRDVGYLSRILGPVVHGSFAVNRAVQLPMGDKVDKPVPEGSAASMVDQTADVLLFTGTARDVETLRKLLPQIDTAVGQVMVRGVVYEVSDTGNQGSAVSVALNLLGGRLSLGMGPSTVLENAFQFKSKSFDAVFSALSSDSRFKVVSQPSLRVRSGAMGRFTVGADVPVLGAVSYPGGGQGAVQSVEYRSSGVIFELQPDVRDAVVDLTVVQQLSDFVQTSTGVNNSPTLTKRELRTALSVADGDVVVLGGLAETKEGHTAKGLPFLPIWMRSRTSESSRSEILLVLQVTRL